MLQQNRTNDQTRPKNWDLNLHIRITHFFLKVVGIWLSSTNRKLNRYRVLFFIFALLPAFCGQLLKISTALNDLKIVTEALLHASITGHALFVYFLIVHKQATITQMMCMVENNFDNLEGVIDQKTTIRAKRERKSSIFIILFVFIAAICIVGYLYLSGFYLFHVDYTAKGLLFPISLPFGLNNSTYYLVFCFQFCTFIGESCVQATSISLYTLVITSLCTELEITGKAFENMTVLVNKKMKECSDTICSANNIKEHADFHARALLRLYTHHHVVLIRFCNDIQKVFRWALLELFVNCEIMLCLSSFQTYQTYQFTSVGQTVTNVNLVIALTWHEFIYFWYGEQLYEKSIDLVRNVFSSGWYNYSLAYRRSILIVLERTKRPLVLYAVIFPVTLATFIKCLQAAISYFNLLVALFREM